MDPAIQTMLDGLLEAIKAENDGYYFYLMSADSTRDPKGREVFKSLAADELGHAKYLKKQYQALLETGEIDSAVKLGERADLAEPSPIFSDELLERVGEAHYEMTSLSIAVQLEHDAIGFYTKQADQATNPQVAAFFRELAEWERSHYHTLLAQQDALKEAYWAKNSFSPF